jgi:hypothetical protein
VGREKERERGRRKVGTRSQGKKSPTFRGTGVRITLNQLKPSGQRQDGVRGLVLEETTYKSISGETIPQS